MSGLVLAAILVGAFMLINVLIELVPGGDRVLFRVIKESDWQNLKREIEQEGRGR